MTHDPTTLEPLLAQGGTGLPALLAADPATARRVLEFFVAHLRNPHTRRAYARAVGEFAR